MRIFFLNLLLIYGFTLAMPVDNESNFSKYASVENGNKVYIVRQNINGVETNTIEVSAFDIKIEGDFFFCGPVKCPKETFKCHVTSEAIAGDLENMKTIAECQDKAGKVLVKKEVTEPNPHPNAEPTYSRAATADREGNVETEDSIAGKQTFVGGEAMDKKQKKEFDEKMKRDMEKLKAQSEEMKKEMDEMKENMDKTFDADFGSFGRNFAFSNSKSAEHFFDPFADHSRSSDSDSDESFFHHKKHKSF